MYLEFFTINNNNKKDLEWISKKLAYNPVENYVVDMNCS